MDVLIGQQRAKLNNRDVIGVGGEATVFRYKKQAAKIYLSPTSERSTKLQALAAHVASLPPEVIGPEQLIFDPTTNLAIGFSMRLLDSSYSEVRKLSLKVYRSKMGLTSKQVMQLFLNAYQTLTALHRSGLVVGDLNDLNLMFCGAEMLFIDVDSFQFDRYPCMVGTETFLDPALYGCDLALKPMFQPENDWYSFAVMLFKSLLLTHPYGGVHPTINLLTQRAQQQISVFDPQVQYPRIAYVPDLLSDDLAHTFDRWFSHGQRGVFPEAVLRDYVATLTVCPSCKATYPANRARCPLCSTVTSSIVTTLHIKVAIQQTVSGTAQVETLIETRGKIVAWHVSGLAISVIAYEKDRAVLYVCDAQRRTRRMVLFNAMPTATYAFLDDKIIISASGENDELWVIDVSGPQPVGLLKTTTGLFGGSQAMFGTSNHSLYRLASGYLMRGQFQYGQLVEQSVLSIAEGQTWFQVAPNAEQVFGYFRALNTYQYWLLTGRTQVEAPLPALADGETLIEIDAHFAANSILIVRRTQLQGADRVHIDEIDVQGHLLRSIEDPQGADFDPIDVHAYAAGMVLHPTDQGIVQERLETRQRKAFTQTAHYVRRGDAIQTFDKGLLAVREGSVIYLIIS